MIFLGFEIKYVGFSIKKKNKPYLTDRIAKEIIKKAVANAPINKLGIDSFGNANLSSLRMGLKLIAIKAVWAYAEINNINLDLKECKELVERLGGY